MRRTVLQVMLAVVALIAVAATAVPSHSRYTYGVIKRACAPWDGRGIQLTVTPKPAECETGAPYLLIYVYDLPIEPGKTYKMGAQASPQIGLASVCPTSDTCRNADSGEVVFDTFEEDKGASGHYKVHFPDGNKKDGSNLDGSFQSKWCNNRELCG
jgi:hypothetical protein